MKLVNLAPRALTVGWLVGRLPAAVRPAIPGLAATFILKGTFQLRPDAPASDWPGRPEQPSGDLPFRGDPKRGLGYASDFVPHKPRAEFAVVGIAHSPQAGLASYPARVRVGSATKSVVIFGPRRWDFSLSGSVPGKPGPAGSVELSYAHAWGGPNYARNPLGCGRDDDTLPLIEYPESLVRGRNSVVEPAGFAPIPVGWPQRPARSGTYDPAWLEERWPWLPEDFDLRTFNAAPAGQWLEGDLRGDEELEFENLHARHPLYRSRLPGLRARCFVEGERDGRADFTEVPLRLDTLWADLEAEQLILVWRGSVPTTGIKRPEMRAVLATVEPLEESAPVAHFREQLVAKLSRRAPSAPDEASAIPDAHAEIAAMKRGFAAQIAELDALPDKVIAARDAEYRRLAGRSAAEFPREGAEVDVAASIGGIEALGARQKAPFGARGELPDWRPEFAGARTGAEDLAGFPAEMEARQRQVIASLPAWMQPPPAPDALPGDADAMRSAGLAGGNFAGVDFSGRDLRGVDFSRANLRGARFPRANLAGANLTEATLVEVDLTDADLSEADLRGVDLGGARVTGARWVRARLDGARFAGLDLSGADFTGADGHAVDFRRVRAAGAIFVHARLPRALFAEADLERADFSAAHLERVAFTGARAHGVRMAGAHLVGARVTRGADFRGADLRFVRAAGSTWKGAVLDGANLQAAELARALFSEASLVGANLDRCDLVEAAFEDARMAGVTLTHANLRRALLDRADLTDANLSGANLYDAGLWEATLRGAQWRGANVKRTRLAA